uniref:Protein sleepless n=1 Tax=Timema cristinae TaxID=61476 RepID=A0A7R9D746_TIMCR|nr:unnamed protein product [Timema cristinae]
MISDVTVTDQTKGDQVMRQGCPRTTGGPHEFPGSPLRPVMGTERSRSGELRSSYSSHCDVLSVVGEDSRTMEHRVKHLLVVTGLLVANLDSGRCVTCWTCSSIIASQDDCKDPFNVSRSFGYKVNCDHELSSPPPGHKQYCKKIVLQPNIHSGFVTERSCAWANESDPQASSCPSLNLRVDFCGVCSQDGCNGSPSFFSTSIMRNQALLGLFILLQSLARAS